MKSVSKGSGSITENRLQHNPMVTNPLTGSLIPWMEISGISKEIPLPLSLDIGFIWLLIGSPFNISTGVYNGPTWTNYLDISHSCMGSYGGDLVITGGRSSHMCTRCSLRVNLARIELIIIRSKWRKSVKLNTLSQPNKSICRPARPMWLCGAWKVTLTTLAGHSLNRYLYCS